MDALGPDIHQLYLQLLSAQDATNGQPPFFHPTPPPPQAPMLFLPPQPTTQGGYARDDFGHGLPPGAGNGALPPGEDPLMLAGADEFLGNESGHFVDGLPGGVDEDPLMGMSDADLTAFLSDEPGADSLCVPTELLMRSMAAYQQALADSPPVPPAGGLTQSSSGSPALGCAQAKATDDSPSGGVVQEPLTRMSEADPSAFLSDVDEAGADSLCVPPELLARSLAAYQAAMADSPSSGSPGLGCAQARATDSPVDGACQQVPDCPQQEPDIETAEVDQMILVAALCGDRPSTAWSVEEDQLLLRGLSQFAGQDNVIRCFSIASGLAQKTALDVAYRIRWLSDLEKKKAAKEAQLGQQNSAVANVAKVKETKVSNKKNNKHPLSKETLDSRSAKDIIRDNYRLMAKIEEILRTGEVNNCPDYFYYVKMNMDAMRNKVKDVGSVMEGLSVGDEEWEDVLKDRNAPQAGEDAATPAP